MDPHKQLAELNGFVVRAQRTLAQYLPPDSGKSEKDVISELLGILDSREIIRLQEQITKEKPALFTH